MDDKQAKPAAQDNSTSIDNSQILPPIKGAADNAANPTGIPVIAGASQTIPTDRSLVATPDVAADNDLIEKEWVLKAKQIVEHTVEDPFKQQEELGKMRADYMKKRYNKDVGLG
jgi:hypothetical protein